jgi:hypothetical protein
MDKSSYTKVLWLSMQLGIRNLKLISIFAENLSAGLVGIRLIKVNTPLQFQGLHRYLMSKDTRLLWVPPVPAQWLRRHKLLT